MHNDQRLQILPQSVWGDEDDTVTGLGHREPTGDKMHPLPAIPPQSPSQRVNLEALGLINTRQQCGPSDTLTETIQFGRRLDYYSAVNKKRPSFLTPLERAALEDQCSEAWIRHGRTCSTGPPSAGVPRVFLNHQQILAGPCLTLPPSVPSSSSHLLSIMW